MGNPLGLTGSVTDGIVSAVGRAVTEPAGDGSPGATLPQAIQTSAAINPGNSGGALVDLSASVIGVPTLAAIFPHTGGSAAPGIGFAIPSNVVTDIAGQLVANGGHVPNSGRAALGIGAVTVVDQNGQPAGVAVGSVVTGGPAAAAGIKPGDVITAVNNTPVQSSAELSRCWPGGTRTSRPGHGHRSTGQDHIGHGDPRTAARQLSPRPRRGASLPVGSLLDLAHADRSREPSRFSVSPHSRDVWRPGCLAAWG